MNTTKEELIQEILKLKLRHSEKVFQLSLELQQDVQPIADKIKALEEDGKKDKKV